MRARRAAACRTPRVLGLTTAARRGCTRGTGTRDAAGWRDRLHAPQPAVAARRRQAGGGGSRGARHVGARARVGVPAVHAAQPRLQGAREAHPIRGVPRALNGRPTRAVDSAGEAGPDDVPRASVRVRGRIVACGAWRCACAPPCTHHATSTALMHTSHKSQHP
eukprot:3074053-Prymnesium_polylepis.1